MTLAPKFKLVVKWNLLVNLLCILVALGFVLDGAEQATPLQKDKWSSLLGEGSTHLIKIIQAPSSIMKWEKYLQRSIISMYLKHLCLFIFNVINCHLEVSISHHWL